MKINKLKNKIQSRGFSLLEVLIYITILSGLMIITSNMFISLSKGSGQTSAKSEVDTSVRFASELLRQDLKNASTVSVPSLGTSSSTLTLVRNGVAIVYDVSSGVLRRKEGINSPVNITNPTVLVGTPVFTRIENTNLDFSSTNVAIKINMTFSYNGTSPDWKYSTSFQTSVSLYPQ